MESNTLRDWYLETCSLEALESLMLARKNVAMNFLDETRKLLELWVQAEMDAKLAEWMLDMRRSQALRAGGSAKLLPAKQLAGPARYGLIEPVATPTEAPPAGQAARQLVPPSAVRKLTAARIPSRGSRRQAIAAPVVGECRRQQGQARVHSRALLSSAAAGGEIQPSPNTECAGTPRSTAAPALAEDFARSDQHAARHAAPELREVLDLLPTDGAIAGVRATVGANMRRRKLDPRGRGAAKPLPERVRFVSSSRSGTAG